MSDNTDYNDPKQPKPRVESQLDKSNEAPVEQQNEGNNEQQQTGGSVQQQYGGNNGQQPVGNAGQQYRGNTVPQYGAAIDNDGKAKFSDYYPSPPPVDNKSYGYIYILPPIRNNGNLNRNSQSDNIGNTLKYTFVATGALFFVVISVTLSILIAKKLKERNRDSPMPVYYKNESAHERSLDVRNTSKSSKNSRSYMNSIEHIKYKNLNIPDDSLNDIDIYSPSINSFSNFSLSQTAVNGNGNGMSGSFLNPQVYDSLYDSNYKMGNPMENPMENPMINNNYYYNNNNNNNNNNKFAFKEVPYGNVAYNDSNPNFYFNKKDPMFDDFIDGSL